MEEPTADFDEQENGRPDEETDEEGHVLALNLVFV
jgi:hypothetical protein